MSYGYHKAERLVNWALPRLDTNSMERARCMMKQ